MLILPSDGTTFQINYKEALGRAIGMAMCEDPDLVVVAAQAFDDYDLEETLRVLQEDLGPQRVLRPEETPRAGSRLIFIAANTEEFNEVFTNWNRSIRPNFWRVPITNESEPEVDKSCLLVPCTTQDAYSMTRAALRQASPTVVLEHKNMYDVEGYVNLDHEEPEAQAIVRREGADMSIIAGSWLLVEALQAAEILAQQGISIEVIDLRRALPLDLETLKQTAEKTKKIIVMDHIPALGFLKNMNLARLAPEASWTFSSDGAGDPIGTKRLIRVVENLLKKPAANLTDIQFYGYGRTFCGPF